MKLSSHFLTTPLRRALEKTVKEARVAAEGAVGEAIRRLGVGDAKPPGYLDEAGQDLRRKLRAHGRALGDVKSADDTQTTDRLIEAAAYVHWHRRLFARFLAERGLLRHPVHQVPITLEDCEELAREEGYADEWAAAEAYAGQMLPAVFRPDDPVLELELATNHTVTLRRLVLGIDPLTFQAADALGWTYQFWRALEKDKVNRSGSKIGAAELPAVTQLFTEPYMVRFLLHNTLGAWWAGKVLQARPELAAEAKDEDELRAAVRLPGYDFDMLRFVKEGEDAPRWRPAAGTYPGWPTEAKALTVLDPCCGSGHFLTEALTILAAMRAREEQLPASDAVAAVLRDNLFGLELDGRCVQIAAFAVALTAWRVGGFQPLPSPHIAWVGAPPPLAKAEFMALANGDEDLRRGLGILHGLFAQAPILGSLLDPDRGDLGDAHGALDFAPMLEKLIAKAKKAEGAEAEVREGVIAARGMADAAGLLRRRYSLIVTNVPFLGRSKQHPALAAFVERNEADARPDLATAMLSRALRLINPGGAIAAVTPQNWLFLGGYKNFRLRLLNQVTFDLIGVVGEGGFESSAAAGAFVATVSLTAREPHPRSTLCLVDASSGESVEEKKNLLLGAARQAVQSDQVKNPDHRITVEEVSSEGLLSDYADAYQGIRTGDSERFTAKFWERNGASSDWRYLRTSVETPGAYEGAESVVFWQGGKGELHQYARETRDRLHDMHESGNRAWGRRGVAINTMRNLRAGPYEGDRFQGHVSVIVPKSESHLLAIAAFCSDSAYELAVRRIERGLNVTNATLVKVPFDLEHWSKVAADKYPNGLPEPYSDDPTQWLFHGHPAKAEAGTQLHVALARLAGYRWPAETDTEMRLSAEARAWIAQAQTLPGSDPDGILTVPAAGGDRPLADRLRHFLAACFGDAWSEALERRLVAEADEKLDKKAARDGSLGAWLRDRAFRQHCRLFHERPFLWQVWDEQKDGFSAFLHYHRLDRGTLQKLTYTLLNDWIMRRKAENDERRVEAAAILQGKLRAILEGEAPFDIFVRWKPLEKQPLGWEPDLDDGVRLNIRPWVKAGVLRETPKIKWGVDRGTDVASAPWYELDKGKRNNDHHFKLADKRAAREGKRAPAA